MYKALESLIRTVPRVTKRRRKRTFERDYAHLPPSGFSIQHAEFRVEGSGYRVEG